MKRVRSLCRAACLIGMVCPSDMTAQNEQWLAAAEARKHVGESVTVCDSVAGTRFAPASPGQPTFLNLGRAFPDQSLTIVIWGEQRARFAKPPELLYRDRRVCVTGTVMLYRSRAQIVVETPTAIRFAAKVDPPQPTLGTRGGRVRHLGAADG